MQEKPFTMPTFTYKGRNAQGDAITGTLVAASPEAVANQLMNTGVVPVDITETRDDTTGARSLWRRLRQRKPGLDDLIQFSRQLHTLMRAGVPIIQALTGLAENVDNPRFAVVLRDIVTDLEAGHDLSSALRQHPELFNELFVSMVQVGEQSGRLDEALLKLSQYLEREKDTQDRIRSALRYPIFVVAAISVAMIIINLFVIPVFAKIFDKFHAELPWQTRLLLGISDFALHYWPHILVLLIGTILAVRHYVKTESGRLLWDRYKLRLPIVGKIINQALLARFANAFAMTLRSGVPLVQGITVVARAVDNAYVAQRILEMRNRVERGESLTQTTSASGLFTPLVLQMIAVGEETGAVDDMLEYVAEFYDREVDYQLKNLSSAIEPILIITIGGMVLILALGVFLPMWDLASVVKGR
jgi:MSHA biogenesis protein MshG